MGRPSIEKSLARTEANITEGEERIARHRQLIADLTAEGRDTTGAIALLELLQDLQAAYLMVRKRLRTELGVQAESERNISP
jgi:hypothetical protein